MTGFRNIVLLAAGIVISGCQPPTRQAGSRIDSAGVHLVIGLGVDSAAPWRLAHAERLAAGDSAHALHLVRFPGFLATDSGGRVFVYNEVAERVEIYGLDGSLIGTRGRRGGGPGEYQYPGQLTVETDGTVLVLDMGKDASIGFNTEGLPLPQRSLRGLGYPLGGVRFWGDTAIISSRDLDSTLRPAHALRVVGPGIDTILAHLAPRTLGQAHFRCPASTFTINGGEVLFAPRLTWAVGGRAIAVAVQDRYDIKLYERTHLQRVLRRQVAAVPASPSHAARLFPEGIQFGTGMSCRKQADELVAQFGLASTLPLLGRLAFAPDGTLWVERYRLPGEVPAMDIFAPSGEYLGTLTGAGFPVGFVSRGRFVGLVPDEESGANQVFLYQLAPQPW